MKIAVSEFKAKCSQIFRSIEELDEIIQVTRRGKIIAVVQPPLTEKADPEEFLNCLQGTISYSDKWDEPLGEEDWDVCSENT